MAFGKVFGVREIDYYQKDFEEYVFNSWNDFFVSEREVYSRWSTLLEMAVRDLGLESNKQVIWHARGTTAKYIITAMHKHEPEDIYDQLPPGILLMRATLPDVMNEQRTMTSEIFKEKANGEIQVIKGTTHLLHWDQPEVVVNAIRKHW